MPILYHGKTYSLLGFRHGFHLLSSRMDLDRFANVLMEAGSLRKIARAHRQTLLTDDHSDNIAAHSFRVALCGYFLAVAEGADIGKVVTMCLFHDLGEARSGDQNWVHKRYVKVFDEEILRDQLDGLTPENQLYELMREYAARETLEAKLAKDADRLDQIMLLKEYSHTGNKEAALWLGDDGGKHPKQMFSQTARELAKRILAGNVDDWWSNIWTEDRR